MENTQFTFICPVQFTFICPVCGFIKTAKTNINDCIGDAVKNEWLDEVVVDVHLSVEQRGGHEEVTEVQIDPVKEQLLIGFSCPGCSVMFSDPWKFSKKV